MQIESSMYGIHVASACSKSNIALTLVSLLGNLPCATLEAGDIVFRTLQSKFFARTVNFHRHCDECCAFSKVPFTGKHEIDSDICFLDSSGIASISRTELEQYIFNESFLLNLAFRLSPCIFIPTSIASPVSSTFCLVSFIYIDGSERCAQMEG